MSYLEVTADELSGTSARPSSSISSAADAADS
jgi:hypothetical protein